MLRLNREEKQAFLRACQENIQRLQEACPQFLHSIYDTVSHAADDVTQFTFDQELKNFNDDLIQSAELDLALMKFLYQFNYSRWLDDESRLAFRKAVAVKELLSILDDEDSLEIALKSPEWHSPQFNEFMKDKNLTILQALYACPADKPLINEGDHQYLHKVLSPDEFAEIHNALTPQEKIILGAVCIELEGTRYDGQDRAIEPSEARNEATKPLTKCNVLHGRLAECVPKLKAISERLKARGVAQPKPPHPSAAHYMCGYYSYPKSGLDAALIQASHQSETIKIVSDGVVTPEDAFQLAENKVPGKLLKAGCRDYKFPIKINNNKWDSIVVGHLDAKVEVTYQFKGNEAGEGSFEVVQVWTDNQYLSSILKTDSMQSVEARMIEKYCDAQLTKEIIDQRKSLLSKTRQTAPKPQFPVTYKQCIDRLKMILGEKNEEDKSYNLSHIELKNRLIRERLKERATAVLAEVEALSKRKAPKTPEGEIIKVLQQTIRLIDTPMYEKYEDNVGQMKMNDDHSAIQRSYSRIADTFKKSGRNTILAGVMMALIGVALVVGFSMLVASTFGAGAAIGIPVLVSAVAVPYFAAGMSLGAVLSNGLGLFSIKPFMRGVGKVKLANAMNKMNAPI